MLVRLSYLSSNLIKLSYFICVSLSYNLPSLIHIFDVLPVSLKPMRVSIAFYCEAIVIASTRLSPPSAP